MTTEEELRKQAGIPAFEARFETYMKQRAEQDGQQKIGRNCDLHFDRGGDHDRQFNEKLEQVDREFDADATALTRQDKAERVTFEEWMKGERDRMREEDVVARAAPRLVPPAFGLAGNQHPPQREPVKDFAQKESLRSSAGDSMRARFDEYQTRQDAERLDALGERRDTNIDSLKEAHGQAVERRKAAFEKPLPWESEDAAKASAEKAMELVQDYNGRQKDREWNSKF